MKSIIHWDVVFKDLNSVCCVCVPVKIIMHLFLTVLYMEIKDVSDFLFCEHIRRGRIEEKLEYMIGVSTGNVQFNVKKGISVLNIYV